MAYLPKTFNTKSEDLETIRLVMWLQDEFRAIARELEAPYTTLHAEPPRPRVGLVVYADGTDWNPGSGEGLYARTSAGWQFLS